MNSHAIPGETSEKEFPNQTKIHRQIPERHAADSQWQFKMLMAVVALCVLMLIGKVLGLF